jgi:ferredoxin
MLNVNQEKCVGCGLCVNMCPESFKMNEEGKSEVINQEVNVCAKEAAASCPVSAIEID